MSEINKNDVYYRMYYHELKRSVTGSAITDQEAWARYKYMRDMADALGLNIPDVVEYFLDITPAYRVCRD